MQSEVPQSSLPEPTKGLPPVAPLTGGSLARQFLVPLLIVIALVSGYVFFLIWVRAAQTPEQYLKSLDNTNPEVRWRAASDLALVLQRDDHLAANASFGLDLADRLRQTRNLVEPSERAIAERLRKYPHLDPHFRRLVQEDPQYQGPADDPEWRALRTEWYALEPSLNYLLYLSSCLGNMSVPVGAPELGVLALKEGADNNILTTRQRVHCVLALAALGNNLGRQEKLTPPEREAVLASLEEEAGKGGLRGTWADKALAELRGKKGALGVESVLARCARSDDPYLRKEVALALAFWEGPGSEATLDDLSADDGHGQDNSSGEDESSKKLPIPQSRYAQEIRYQAWLALTRRGSHRLRQGFGPLPDMLDEVKLNEQFPGLLPGQKGPEVAQVQETILSTLKALVELHRRRPDLDLSPLYPAVEKLTQNANGALGTEARKTLLALRGK
jgi:hypothetical protein